jgi:hypothetical protein
MAPKCKANVGPKVATWRGVIWPRDSLLLGGRRREPRGGQGLKYPAMRLSMIWLVRILWFMLIGGWAEGGFKLDLRQDPDPGKQKLKGAVRTGTYRCHYCQQKPQQFLKILICCLLHLQRTGLMNKDFVFCQDNFLLFLKGLFKCVF